MPLPPETSVSVRGCSSSPPTPSVCRLWELLELLQLNCMTESSPPPPPRANPWASCKIRTWHRFHVYNTSLTFLFPPDVCESTLLQWGLLHLHTLITNFSSGSSRVFTSQTCERILSGFWGTAAKRADLKPAMDSSCLQLPLSAWKASDVITDLKIQTATGEEDLPLTMRDNVLILVWRVFLLADKIQHFSLHESHNQFLCSRSW